MKHPHSEIELKLLVPPEAVQRLHAHPLLKGPGRPRKTRLRSVYYDTPALDLWRLGIALRLRREGRRWVQAVKGGGTARGGLHQRAEYESEVTGPSPDISRIRDGELAGVFASLQLRAQLKPVFVTDVLRSSRDLELDSGARVEASVDQGVIRSGNRTEVLSEFELELKDGKPHQLYELALKLAQDVPLSIGDRSKAERGYALARGEPETPVKARPAMLDGGMSVNDAFKAVMWANLAHLQANERGMLEGRDPEFLHQMRVALRRLRSAVAVFAALFPGPVVSPVRTELRWLAGSLGAARDWDVLVTETLPPIEAEFGPHEGLRDFAARCEKLRRLANQRARRAVRSARYRRLGLWLAAWLASEEWLKQAAPEARATLLAAIGGYAGAVLERRYGQVRRKGRKLADLSATQLHRLRIAIKKFRYAADFFAGLYDAKAAREALKRLSGLQDILGSMNDAATVASLMAHGFDGAQGRRVREARGMLLGWSRGRAATLKRELKSAWKTFRSAGKFWSAGRH